MNLGKRVVIVQPYVPDYRVPFFDMLVETMRERDVDVEIVAPVSHNGSGRSDQTAGNPWHVESSARSFRIGRATFTYYGSRRLARRADAVIVPAAGTCLDTHLALYFGRVPTGLWGHIANYVNRENPVDRVIERQQLRRADYVFAYMPSGARRAIAEGVPPSRVTAVMNTIDTGALGAISRELTALDVEEFGETHSLFGSTVLAYIGSLDHSKRVDFLASALDELWKIQPSIRLVVMGRGDQEHLLNTARARGQVVMLGRVGPREKVLVSKYATALANPGRIGLVAVDALALGLPIITAHGAQHAPEFEYLVEGSTLFTSMNNPKDFARELSNAHSSASAPEVPQLWQMVDHIASGISQLLQS